MATTSSSPALDILLANVRDVQRLTEIHVKVVGEKPGHKHDVEVLNKSAIVLLVACWESFVEELATSGFDHLLATVKSPASVPSKVRALACKPLRESQNEGDVWKLAGDGWRTVLQDHRSATLAKYIGSFNTPHSDNVEELLESVVGLRAAFSQISWRGMPRGRPAKSLNALVKLRGDIAHKVKASRPVRKAAVQRHYQFVMRLAGNLSNRVGTHLETASGVEPWPLVEWDGT